MKRIRRSPFSAALTLLLTLCILFGSVTGCAAPITATDLSADYSRTTSHEGEVSEAFILAMADFSLDLTNTAIGQERENRANHLVSPLSALLALALLANGAEGDTRAQMESVLGMSIEDLNRALYAYTNSLYEGDDCTVSTAESIWYRTGEGFQIRPEFLQVCADWYEAQQYAAPFDETTRRDINNWVKTHTNGMIDTMLEDPIPPDTVMYLINALVFDAKWQEEYRSEQIADRTFTSLSGRETTVDMLHSGEEIYLTVEGGQGFAKAYKGRGYSFVGLLPDEGVNVYDFVASLDGRSWISAWQNQIATEVKVQIPEFTYDCSLALKPVLREMGMTLPFDDDLCDLSGIGTSSAGKLHCDGVYQKTYIEVDRHGTKAAAITWAENKEADAAPTEPKYVYLNRPFVYAIVDNQTGLPLFVGIVTELD